MERRLLSVTKVARILDTNDDHVYSLIRKGVLPSVRLGRKIRIDEKSLEEWIKRGGTTE